MNKIESGVIELHEKPASLQKLIEDVDTPVGIVSNNFHVYRGCRYAKYAGFKNPFPIAASCHPLLFPNYFVRECFAVWKLWLKKY